MAPGPVVNQGTLAAAASWTRVRLLSLVDGEWLVGQYVLLHRAWKAMRSSTSRWQRWISKSAWASLVLQLSSASDVLVLNQGCLCILLMSTRPSRAAVAPVFRWLGHGRARPLWSAMGRLWFRYSGPENLPTRLAQNRGRVAGESSVWIRWGRLCAPLLRCPSPA